MSKIKLQKWAQSLSLQDRIMVQMFIVRLYAMEIKDGK